MPCRTGLRDVRLVDVCMRDTLEPTAVHLVRRRPCDDAVVAAPAAGKVAVGERRLIGRFVRGGVRLGRVVRARDRQRRKQRVRCKRDRTARLGRVRAQRTVFARVHEVLVPRAARIAVDRLGHIELHRRTTRGLDLLYVDPRVRKQTEVRKAERRHDHHDRDQRSECAFANVFQHLQFLLLHFRMYISQSYEAVSR